jgi:DNA-directed RNA polymerase specialized sigma24 family protein
MARKINYSDIATLKKILNSYYELKECAKDGNILALSICVDIEIALKSDKLNEKQRYCVVESTIKGRIIAVVAEDLEASTSYVYNVIQQAIKIISEILTADGEE